MKSITIPLFVKNLGSKVVAHILNLNDQDAKNVLENKYELTKEQGEILNSYIQICRNLRIQAIDQGDPDFSLFHGLPQLIENERHIFNIWREQFGGKLPKPDETDRVVYFLSKMALEIYPLFLIQDKGACPNFKGTYFHLSAALFRFPSHKNVTKAILDDASFKKIFSHIGEDEIQTGGQYRSSTGRGGTLQLATLPSTMITNSYELMRLRGKCSAEELLAAINETTEMLRDIAENKLVHVPVFLGFHNVGLPNNTALETDWGIIRSFNEGLLELIPSDAQPSQLGGEYQLLGFVLESVYPYKADFTVNTEEQQWPKEFYEEQNKLDIVQENLSLALALSIERNPPVGILPAWRLVFDLLSNGTNISWRTNRFTPVPHHMCSTDDLGSIKKWSLIIDNTNDTKIRIAIRRVLSAVNERLDPVDGFIDTIIAWENLFGSHGELRFRISMAIACLLEQGEENRLKLQNKVIKYYDDRSDIVHGVKDITMQEAKQKRNECLDIALKCIKKLYESRQDLIADAERSKTILIQ